MNASMGPSTIFISYSRSELAYVRRLVKHLADLGLQCWYDCEMVRGDSFPHVIAEKIRTSAALLLVMTPSAAASRWVNNEITYAQQNEKPVIPLLLEGKPIISVATLDYEDVQGGRMPGERLVARLKSLAGVIDSPRPAPAPRPQYAPPPPPPPASRSGPPAASAAPAATPQPMPRPAPRGVPDRSAAASSPGAARAVPAAAVGAARVTTSRTTGATESGAAGGPAAQGTPPARASAKPVVAPSSAPAAEESLRSGFVVLGLNAASHLLGWYATSAWSGWAVVVYLVLAGLSLLVALRAVAARDGDIASAAYLFAVPLALWLLACLCVLMWRIWLEHQGVGWGPPVAALGQALLSLFLLTILAGNLGAFDEDASKKVSATPTT